MRRYIVTFWVNDNHDELEFLSDHRAGSNANRADALRNIRHFKGNYIANRAEIIDIYLKK